LSNVVPVSCSSSVICLTAVMSAKLCRILNIVPSKSPTRLEWLRRTAVMDFKVAPAPTS